MTRKPKVGKRVGGFLYVHRDALDFVDGNLRENARAAAAVMPEFVWNVVKLSSKEASLLHYEDFDAAVFPTLLRSAKVDLASGIALITDFSGRANPPILHRKETLLRPDDPRRPGFAALTSEVESKGLFHEAHLIGNRQQWDVRLASAGLKTIGNRLVELGDDAVEVARHKTAIIRRDLSQPMQMMLRLGMVERGGSVFDYGCGQGDDVAILQANGFEAFGWDPYHAPRGPRREAEVVNLGFVLNVIENPHERVETLKAAWGFARRVLTVAVMVQGKYPVSGLRPYKDGFLTNRGTFQRFFAQDDLREIVSKATGELPVALAPGIVSVFRDKELEQEVGYRRRSRASFLSDAFESVQRVRSAPERAPKRAGERVVGARVGLDDPRIAPVLAAVWTLALDFGRLPHPSELPAALVAQISGFRISVERAIALASQSFDAALLAQAAEARRDDLLVHFALQMFPGAVRYTTLARAIQRDVRMFFGSHSTAIDLARVLLFSVGQAEVVEGAAVAAAESGLATWIGGVFRCQMSTLQKLPPALRVVTGCAEVIEQDLAAYDFLEIVPSKGLLRGIRCDDLERQLPVVIETVEVDLKGLRRRRSRPKDTILYLKSRFMPKDDIRRSVQEMVDQRFVAAGLVSEAGDGPTGTELRAKVRASGSISGSS